MIIKSNLLSKFPELIHGFSTKEYGNIKLKSDFNIEQTIKNREKFCADLGISVDELININLAHTANIAVVGQSEKGRGAKDAESLIFKTDGLATNKKNLFLMTTGADCPPVLFYDPVKQVVGNIHVGWRGLLRGIVEKMIEILKIKYGCKVENINVFIGPGIGKCHFEVEDDVAARFVKDYKKFITMAPKEGCSAPKAQIDLKGIIKFILLNNGFKNDNIDVSSHCTFCRDDLFSSYRRDGKEFKAMGAVIGMVENAKLKSQNEK